ncbi:ThuA domain-containing protein [Bacteroidota bacterium]
MNFLSIGKNWNTILLVFILSANAQFNTTQAQELFIGDEAESFFEGVNDVFKRQINLSLPKKARDQSTDSRKILVFNMHKNRQGIGKGHVSIPFGNYMLYMMGEKTGAWETWFSRDTLVFKREVLNKFDAICFNNTAGVLFNDPELRNNLLEYVYSGKGFIGLHAAGATFVQYPVYDQFPEFGVMLGGYENGGHPWTSYEWITIKVNEPDHPLNMDYRSVNFDICDEVFQFSEPYSRDNLRVLVSIDTDKTDMTDSLKERRILPERKADLDIALAWIKGYGRGKVYYSSFGDNPHVNWDPRILRQNLAGIQFVLGDLEASYTPNNKLTPAIEAQEKLGWRLGLTAYSFKDNTLFETIDQAAELGVWHLGGLNVQKVSKNIDKNFDHNLTDKELIQIRQRFVTAGVKLVTYYIHDIPNDEETCYNIFEFGRKMGIETFISEPKPEALDLIDQYCAKYNIKVAIHNHGKKISPKYWNPKGILKACKRRSPYIGACGDIGYWIRSGIDPVEAIELIGDRLITLQVHDLNEITEDGHDVPWGTGETDLNAFFMQLKAHKIKPSLVGLEYSYKWGESLPDIKESIKFFNATSIDLAD